MKRVNDTNPTNWVRYRRNQGKKFNLKHSDTFLLCNSYFINPTVCRPALFVKFTRTMGDVRYR
jgi:hypothetical protein